MRRLPPQQIEKNLSDLIDLVSSTFMLEYYFVEEIVCSGVLTYGILSKANEFIS